MEDPDFEQLRSARLSLRRFRSADAEVFTAYRSDPEVARYQGWISASLEESREFIASLQKLAPGTPGAWFQFAVTLGPEGPLIGDCALRCQDEEAELGFSFARAYQHQGYAGEALGRLLPYGFETLGLKRVLAITDERNRSARRLLERLGFRSQGAANAPTFFKGEWVREVGYSLTRKAWMDG